MPSFSWTPDPRLAPGLALACLLLVPACSEDPAPADSAETSSSLQGSDQAASAPDLPPAPDTLEELKDPEQRITDLEEVEERSETVANLLIQWGEALRGLQFEEARDFLAEDFLGHDFARSGPATETSPGLGIRATRWDVSHPPVVHRDPFLDGLRDFLTPFRHLDVVLPKVKKAEFSTARPEWGVVTLAFSIQGTGNDGAPASRSAWARARVRREEGRWSMDRLVLQSLDGMTRERPLFTEVSVPAGVDHQGPAFGKEGNDSFFWNGAAVQDFDGDGRPDLFVPSDHRNFLYHNQGDGTFEEIAQQAGVAGPGGGTGCLFVDVDNDGDQDLFVGHVAFEQRGALQGGPCRLYRNLGDRTFQDVTGESGLDTPLVAFSVGAADVDADGWIDLYVASYNAEGFTSPDSWHQADNGTPNALFMNQGDGTFRDEAAARGVADQRWSYAVAFADFDQDGDQDLYVANDYAANALYVNQGDGVFVDRARDLGVEDVGNGMGVSWGDQDQDGDLDLYVSNMSSTAGNRILGRLADPKASEGIEQTLFKLAAGNSLFTWNGERFERQPGSVGGIGASWAWSARFCDLELDGDLDLLCVNGFLSGNEGADFKDT